MITLVLDSSVFLRDPTREGTAFRALERMQAAGLLRLCIPAVVQREVTAHLRGDAEECASKLDSAFNDVERRLPVHVQGPARREVRTLLAKLRASLPEDTERAFDLWLHEMSVDVLPVTPDDTREVLDGYFDGSPPYRGGRSRQDIPDAFIFAALRRFAPSISSLHFVAGDKRLRDACEGILGIKTWEKLQHFFAYEAVAELLASNRARLNVVALTPHLWQHHKGLDHRLTRQLKDYMSTRPVRSLRIPSAGNEATVAEWGTAYGLELLWEAASYDGLTSILVPFRWMSEADLRFRVTHNALTALSESEIARVSLSHLTSEALTAERLYDMTVYGDAVVALSSSLDADFTEEQLDRLAASATISVEGRPTVELSDVQDRHRPA